jgi:hypothetical protein
MKIDTILNAIENYKTLGIQTPSNKDEIGWYIISKRELINNFFEKFSTISDSTTYNEQVFIKENPYIISEYKVTKKTFDRGYISNNEDYTEKNHTYFKTFEATLEFIKNKGFTEENLIWLVDLIYID